jgi:hypothetical protein
MIQERQEALTLQEEWGTKNYGSHLSDEDRAQKKGRHIKEGGDANRPSTALGCPAESRRVTAYFGCTIEPILLRGLRVIALRFFSLVACCT